jgi:hypothetical protein
LILTEGIPLEEILNLLTQVTKKWAVIEWVEPEDTSVYYLARGRNTDTLRLQYFEKTCQAFFKIIKKEKIEGMNRTLYLLEIL